jgi:hypothetical protein
VISSQVRSTSEGLEENDAGSDAVMLARASDTGGSGRVPHVCSCGSLRSARQRPELVVRHGTGTRGSPRHRNSWFATAAITRTPTTTSPLVLQSDHYVPPIQHAVRRPTARRRGDSHRLIDGHRALVARTVWDCVARAAAGRRCAGKFAAMTVPLPGEDSIRIVPCSSWTRSRMPRRLNPGLRLTSRQRCRRFST